MGSEELHASTVRPHKRGCREEKIGMYRERLPLVLEEEGKSKMAAVGVRVHVKM